MKSIFPQPKKSPLRTISQDLPNEKKVLMIKKESVQTVALVQNQPQTEYDIAIEDDAQLTLSLPPQKFPDSHLDIVIRVGAHASCVVEQRTTEQHTALTTIQVLLEGEEAIAKIRARYHGQKDSHHGLMILMHHKVPHTTGDIAIRGVYEHESRALFSGLIKIDKDAQQTLSYFKDDVLLLDDALAESLPTLEIEANDVKASHGSTTSRINEDELFYMQSRGIGREKARTMIIEGFLRFED